MIVGRFFDLGYSTTTSSSYRCADELFSLYPSHYRTHLTMTPLRISFAVLALFVFGVNAFVVHQVPQLERGATSSRGSQQNNVVSQLTMARPTTTTARPETRRTSSSTSTSSKTTQRQRRRQPSKTLSDRTTDEFRHLIRDLIQTAVEAGPRVGPARTLQAYLAFSQTAREFLPRPGQSVEPFSFPKVLRSLFEKMGATYIKLGQFIASSPTLFPKEYVLEFQKCLDQTDPLDWSVIEKVIVEELGPISKTFQFVDKKPLASASIAQVGVLSFDNLPFGHSGFCTRNILINIFASTPFYKGPRSKVKDRRRRCYQSTKARHWCQPKGWLRLCLRRSAGSGISTTRVGTHLFVGGGRRYSKIHDGRNWLLEGSPKHRGVPRFLAAKWSRQAGNCSTSLQWVLEGL